MLRPRRCMTSFKPNFARCDTDSVLNQSLSSSKKVSLGMTASVISVCMQVFARTSPEQKEVILKTLRAVGYTTLMCGDGTNDVGALKASYSCLLLSEFPLRFLMLIGIFTWDLPHFCFSRFGQVPGYIIQKMCEAKQNGAPKRISAYRMLSHHR